jgi:predicted kinase
MENKRRRLVVICGPPCSGKSPIAEWLENEHRLPRLEMDCVREELFPLGSNTFEERQLSYAAMHLCARHLSRSGVKLLSLVATYQPWLQRQAVTRLAEDLGASLLVVQLKVDPIDAGRRFWKRPDDHPAKDLTEERVLNLAQNYPYFTRAPIIDTSRLALREVQQAVIDALDIADGKVPGPIGRSHFSEWVELAKRSEK